MTGEFGVALPLGLWRNGACHRTAVLRPLTGRDEEFLAERGSAMTPAARTTAVLARCLSRLGNLDASEQICRDLPVGDREALLLNLRRQTFGERIDAVLDCPQAGCGEKLDLALRVGDLLLPPAVEPKPLYERDFQTDGSRYRLRFRVPTGADLEEVAQLASQDEHAAVSRIVERCVDGAWKLQGGRLRRLTEFPPSLAQPLSEAMAEVDFQAEIRLAVRCPGCGAEFETLFDAAHYLFEEISARMGHLFREIHLLALHYHWSESEILGLTTTRRQRYLDLLFESPSGGEEPA